MAGRLRGWPRLVPVLMASMGLSLLIVGLLAVSAGMASEAKLRDEARFELCLPTGLWCNQPPVSEWAAYQAAAQQVVWGEVGAAAGIGVLAVGLLLVVVRRRRAGSPPHRSL